jgi:ABC-type polysaccharide/polyol phosphate export permease
MTSFNDTFNDWSKSIRLASLWSNLAIEDLHDRYRRTALGLIWIVASFALFVMVKVLIFGQLTTASTTEFGLFVTIGFGLWAYVNSMVMDACTAYMHARPWILASAIPYPVFLLQAVLRNWMIFGLTMLVMAVALYWKTSDWSPRAWSVLPALACYFLTSVWLAAILAPLCARYRDIHHAVQTGLRLIFFATPILWMPADSGKLAMIARLNPISHYIAIVREPFIYDRIPVESWIIVLAFNIAGFAIGLFAYAATRRRVAHWV